MRIKLIPRADGRYTLMAEVQLRKGRKVTTGNTVPWEGIRAEAGRLYEEVRRSPAENAS